MAIILMKTRYNGASFQGMVLTPQIAEKRPKMRLANLAGDYGTCFGFLPRLNG